MELQRILPDLIKEIVKQTLESIMVIKEHGGTKNGFYVRNLDTVLGKLKNLKIPRDREGRFKTKLIEPYKRRDINLENLILGMFASGMSARAVAQALEGVFELKYSPSTKGCKVLETGAFPSVSTIEKFVYLRIAMLNDRWSNRVVNGFLEIRKRIQETFSKRYS